MSTQLPPNISSVMSNIPKGYMLQREVAGIICKPETIRYLRVLLPVFSGLMSQCLPW